MSKKSDLTNFLAISDHFLNKKILANFYHARPFLEEKLCWQFFPCGPKNGKKLRHLPLRGGGSVLPLSFLTKKMVFMEMSAT